MTEHINLRQGFKLSVPVDDLVKWSEHTCHKTERFMAVKASLFWRVLDLQTMKFVTEQNGSHWALMHLPKRHAKRLAKMLNRGGFND